MGVGGVDPRTETHHQEDGDSGNDLHHFVERSSTHAFQCAGVRAADQRALAARIGPYVAALAQRRIAQKGR